MNRLYPATCVIMIIFVLNMFNCKKSPKSSKLSSDSLKYTAHNYRDQTYLNALRFYQKDRQYELAITCFKEYIHCAIYSDSARVDSARHYLQIIRQEYFFQPDTIKQVTIQINDTDVSEDETMIKLRISNHRLKPLEFTSDHFFLIDKLRSKIKPQQDSQRYRINPGDSLQIKLQFEHPRASWSTFVFFIPEIQLSLRKIYSEP